MRSLALCLFVLIAELNATSITQTSTMTVTPYSGVASCNETGTGGMLTCSSSDPQQFAQATAIANASPGFVSVELFGGATRSGTWATATSLATNNETYLFSNGTGTGILTYQVALIGFATGMPVASPSVLLNGTSYSVLPNAAPTYYSFTRTFTYGRSFSLPLSIQMTSNWDGSLGDGGSRFASAQLTSVSVAPNFPLGAAAISEVPEPPVATMWIGGGLLTLLGLRRKPEQR